MAVVRSRPQQVQARLERRGGLRLQAQEGPQRGHRRRDLVEEGRAALDDATSACAACALFERKPMAAVVRRNMPDIDFHDIYYYLKPTGEQVDEWDELPEQMKDTYEKLGIPEAERKYLAGVTAQYESEVVYHRNREDLERAGRSSSATWTPRCASTPSSSSSTSARSSRPATTSSPRSTRRCGRAARSSTCRRASTCEMPLQAYFRINAENVGQFERTLIIADEGSPGALHRGLLGAGVHHRLAALGRRRDRRQAAAPGSPTRPSRTGRTNVFNLVTKRARVEAEGHMEWIDGNIGSQLTMKYPARLPGRPEGHRARCCRSPTPAPASTRTPGPRWSTPRPRPRRRSCPSRSPRTAAAPPTAAWSGSRRAPTAARATCSATR